MSLLVFSEFLVFALWGEPETEGDSQGGEGHDCERCPVEDVWRELAVVVFERDDGTLSWGTADGVLDLKIIKQHC